MKLIIAILNLRIRNERETCPPIIIVYASNQKRAIVSAIMEN